MSDSKLIVPQNYAELRRAVEVAMVHGQQAVEQARVRTYHETGRLIQAARPFVSGSGGLRRQDHPAPRRGSETRPVRPAARRAILPRFPDCRRAATIDLGALSAARPGRGRRATKNARTGDHQARVDHRPVGGAHPSVARGGGSRPARLFQKPI